LFAVGVVEAAAQTPIGGNVDPRKGAANGKTAGVRKFEQNSRSEICKSLPNKEINFFIFLKRASFILREM
jgi:hypothetical protein